MTPDTIALPHAVGVLEELVAQIQQRELPEPCFVGVLPGSAVAVDYIGDGCPGMAFVRIGSVYASANFPNPDARAHGKSAGLGVIIYPAVAIEVGMYRTIAVPDNGEPLDADTALAATELQLADMAAMLCAIAAYAEASGTPLIMGAYAPYGPEGAAVGGSWTANLGIANSDG